ncbi:hypothetical protein SOPP22_16215 [Shewanella sp. OPT22]|nr:hypothetical protein SOPP22_16215 [Shewanella sp. OPT22]
MSATNNVASIELLMPLNCGDVDSQVSTSDLIKISQELECKLTVRAIGSDAAIYRLKLINAGASRAQKWNLYCFHTNHAVGFYQKSSLSKADVHGIELSPVSEYTQDAKDSLTNKLAFKVCDKLNSRPGALIDAVNSKNAIAVSEEIKRGVNVNYSDDGKSILLLAVEQGNAEIVQMLLNAGARLSNPKAILMAAVKSDNVPLVEMLFNSVSSVPELRVLVKLAVSKNNIDIVNVLLSKGFKVTDASALLSKAIKNNNIKLVSLILTSVDSIDSVDKIYSFLDSAVTKGNVDLVSVLVSKFAPNSLQSREAKALLYRAVEYGNSAIVELIASKCSRGLLNQNIDNGDLCEYYGRVYTTLLGWAATRKMFEVCMALLNSGADINKPFLWC